MKSYAKSKIIILLSLGVLFVLSLVINNSFNFNVGNSDKGSEYSDDSNLDSKNLKISAVSGKIHIDNNWSAAKIASICTGNGTYSEPYVIEDLVIDGGGSGSCILIENSNVYFRIENCTLYNAGGSSGNAGILLSNVNLSQLINNNCSSNSLGISLSSSDYSNISGNIANYNIEGIIVSESNYNNISGNTVYYNSYAGITVDKSNYTTVSGNIISYNDMYGMIVGRGNYISVTGNMMNDCGLLTGGSLEELNSQDIDTTNLVNGKPIYYYTNEVNLGPNDFTNAGQVILVNCNDSIISNLDVSHGTCGICLILCDNNIISGNNANYNYVGIYIYSSDNNDIIRNTANYKDAGIYLYRSDNNDITRNTANYNDLGIYISGSDNNDITRNTANYNELGIYLINSVINSISENTINNNNVAGIYMVIGNDNNISGNIINYNNEGINLFGSVNNSISGNMVFNNDNLGIQLNFNCHDNNITLNCFINNYINAYDYGSNNHWDNGIKGNYWSNYTGLDTDGDGIGDVPYNITGFAGSQDNFPLMKCPISAQGGGGIPIKLIILISVISGGAVIGVATILLIIRKRNRIQ